MSNQPTPGPYFKVKVKSSFDKDTWYSDKIGKTILVRTMHPMTWGYEAKNGRTVFRHDVEAIKKVA